MRAVAAARRLLHNARVGYDDQSEGYRVMSDIESEIRWAMERWAQDCGVPFGAAYGLACRWADEPLFKGFGSAIGKGA